MIDNSAIGHLLRDPKTQSQVGRHPLAASLGLSGGQSPSGFLKTEGGASGIPSLGQGNSATGFQDLVAMAQAHAEMASHSALMGGGPVSQESARGLAQMRAMGMQNDMLAGLVGLDQGGGSDASQLVGRANAEALLSANNFGNLLGYRSGAATADTGRTFSPEQLRSWRQKNEGLRPTVGSLKEVEAETETAAAGTDNLKMPYGLIRPPARTAKAGEAEFKSTPETTPAEQAKVDGPIKSESALLAAQKQDAAANQDDAFTREKLDKLVDKVALALNMDPNLVKAVIKTESNFDHKAVSKVGAKGLMQLMPGTAKDLGVEDPFNPVENVWAGARYLKKMIDRHGGNVNNALASYNWGPGNFDRYGKSGKMPGETRRYISIVNQHYASFKKADTSRA